MKRIIAVLLSIVLSISLTGCSETKEQEQSFRPSPDFKPLNKTVDGRKNIYLIVKNLESSYWKVMIEGAKAGGDDFQCNIYYSGTYVETDWKEHERLLDAAEDAGADAILLAPDDSVKLSGKIDEIYKRGTPIIFLDTIANTDSYNVCYMTDNLMVGQQAAEEMMSQLKKSGVSEKEKIQIGLQLGAASSQTISERLAGFFKYWSKNAPKSWEVIQDIECNDGYLDKAEECAEKMLKYPKLRGVFDTNNSSTRGFAKVVRDHKRKKLPEIGYCMAKFSRYQAK